MGGALLTSLLGVSAVPAQTHFMPRPSYAVLSVFFAALVALAPAIYGLLKAGGQRTNKGALLLFGSAAAVTVWATIGQLGAAVLLFFELASARAISTTSAGSARLAIVGVAIAVVVYGFRAVNSYTRVRRWKDEATAAARPWALL